MSTTISVKYPIIGAKVIRGKNWCYGDQDGGLGNVGTIVKGPNIGRSGVGVRVKWKNDTIEFWYYTGYDNRFDLYFATEEDALLQEVMEKFPSGCSYIDTDNISVVNVEYDYPYYWKDGMIALKEYKGLVYKDGVWAKRTDTKGSSLLEEAKCRFPIGTIFSNTNLGYGPTCVNIKVIGSEFHITNDGRINIDGNLADQHGERDGTFTIYKDGKWATITNNPDNIKEMIIIQAQTLYPIGTKFLDLVYNKEFTVKDTNIELYGTTAYIHVEKRDDLNNKTVVWTDEPYSGNKARIYDGTNWAKIVSKKEERLEVFPGIYVGDIVVSLSDVHNSRKFRDLYEVLKTSTKRRLYYKDRSYSFHRHEWRLATPEEIRFYNSGGKNINDMKPSSSLSPLEVCKQMFPVGTIVETTINGTTHVEEITQQILAGLSVYARASGSISCVHLSGWLYNGETKEYAKIINSQSNINKDGNSNNTGLKIQRPNLKISRTIRTRGIGLKSPTGQIRFGSGNSSYQK